MKEFIIENLKSEGYEIVDYGVYSPEKSDYPDSIHPLAKDINDKRYPFGIIMCGSGNGAQMVANKYAHVRAALCWSEEITKLARQHNNANIISLPGRFLDFGFAFRLVKIFLDTPFEGGRHIPRVQKIPIGGK